MKRKIKMLASIVAAVIMLVSVTVMAETKDYDTYKNGIFSIDCYISCNSSTGVGKTKGAPSGKYNRATIIIYNQNGYSLGSNTTHAFQEAVARKTDIGKVYSALSCHLVADTDFNSTMELYKPVQRAADRY